MSTPKSWQLVLLFNLNRPKDRMIHKSGEAFRAERGWTARTACGRRALWSGRNWTFLWEAFGVLNPAIPLCPECCEEQP